MSAAPRRGPAASSGTPGGRRPGRPDPLRKVRLVRARAAVSAALASAGILLAGWQSGMCSVASTAATAPRPRSIRHRDHGPQGPDPPGPERAARAGGTYPGAVVETRFGSVQVQITVAAGHDHRRDGPPADRCGAEVGPDQQPGRSPATVRGAPGPVRRRPDHQRRHRHQRRLPDLSPGGPRCSEPLIRVSRGADASGPQSEDLHQHGDRRQPRRPGRRCPRRRRSTAATAVVERLFAGLDETFSLYRAGSEASRLARGEITLRKASDPDAEPLRRGRQLAASDRRRLLPGTAGRRGLDLSGIVKGHAVRDAGEIAAGPGARDWCLNAGGDVLVSGSPAPDGPPSDVRELRCPGGPGSSTRRTADRCCELYRWAARSRSWPWPPPGPLNAATISGRPERGRPEFSQVSVAAADIVTADVLATAIVAGGTADAGPRG